jgi:hypothetical protein
MMLVGWRDSRHFDEAERASTGRASGSPVEEIRFPTRCWPKAIRHYDEEALASSGSRHVPTGST